MLVLVIIVNMNVHFESDVFWKGGGYHSDTRWKSSLSKNGKHHCCNGNASLEDEDRVK